MRGRAGRGGAGTIGALLAFAIVAGLVWYLWSVFHGKAPVMASVDWSDPAKRDEIVGRDSAGAILWRHHLPAPAERYNRISDNGGVDYPAPGEGKLARLGYLIRRKAREGVMYLPEFENPQVEDVILSFDPLMGLRWAKGVREVIGPMAKRFPSGWTEKRSVQFTVGGVRRTVILFDHTKEWPSVLVVLDDAGAVLGRFTHAGHLASLDLDVLPLSRATWAAFLLASSGTSARGAQFLAVFDALDITGSTPEDAQSPYHCAECGPPGQGARLYELPRTEVERVGNLPVESSGLSSSDDYSQGMPNLFAGHVNWYFSEDFERARVLLGDDYWQKHQELEASGRITHTRANCPEPRGPRTIRAWRPDGGWRELPLEP